MNKTETTADALGAEERMLLTLSDVVKWMLMNFPQDNLSQTICYELVDRLNVREKELLS